MRNEPNLIFSKKAYYRKQSVEKLYKLMKRKVLIDMRTVKRFRIWQILVLKRKIAIFMRKVKETNKRFLHRSLKVIIEVLKKPMREAYNSIQASQQKIQIPKFLSHSVAVCKFSIINLKLLAKSVSFCMIPAALSKENLKLKTFGIWKSRAYQASPFLHRNLVLALSTMQIILKHRWHHLNFAWQKVSKLRKRIETIMLPKCVKKISKKKIAWAFRKIFHPRFPRRKLEAQKKPKLQVNHIKTGTLLLDMMLRKKKGIDAKQMDLKLNSCFSSWKQLATENSVPNFIMKRHYRSWSLKLMVNSLKYLQDKVKSSIFFKLKSAKFSSKSSLFQIDKHIIENQAQVMEKLESQHYIKLQEAKVINKYEKLNKCHIIFWKCLMRWIMRWKDSVKSPDNLEVIYI